MGGYRDDLAKRHVDQRPELRDDMDVLKLYVDIRFRLWSGNDSNHVIYEQCPEEGPGVSKTLKKFLTLLEAEEWLDQHKQAYLTWLRSFVRITASQQPSKAAPSAHSTTASLRKATNPVKPSSPRPSPGSDVPSKASSFATLPGSSSSATIRVKIPADEVVLGDVMIYGAKRFVVDKIDTEVVAGSYTFKFNEGGEISFGPDDGVTVERSG